MSTDEKPSSYAEAEQARRKLERIRKRAVEAEREVMANLSPEALRVWKAGEGGSP